MIWLGHLYRKQEKLWCSVLFPLILLLYPLLLINQGVDVSDSTYSLTNFLYFQEMEGMWIVSTYLANLFGWLFMKLPFGETLLGMNFYTGLLVSATVLAVYYALRKWMPGWIIFLGELVAIGFLWIPTTILYNYLTYFLFTLGTLFLYRGLVEEKNSFLFLSGILLGMNIFVRIPNLTEMALILGLWYYLFAKGRKWFAILKKTGLCILGYCAGSSCLLILVMLQYGVEGLVEAMNGLAGIQSTDASYAPFAMILSVFQAYFRSGKWLMILGISTAFGVAMFAIKKGKYLGTKRALFLMGIGILFRFLWGRGMFSFRYYEDYTSMYEWGMMGLFLSWIAAVYMLGSKRTSKEEKLMAVLTMVILGVTPLGSNNYTYQNLNNLFLAAPFTLYTFVKLYRYRPGKTTLSGLSFPWKAMVAAVGGMILIQSTGFHLEFTFRDGMKGEPRETLFMVPDSLRGMKTNKQNAKELEGLFFWLAENDFVGDHREEESVKVVLYGDCPGISFLFHLPPAIGTAWPDLDSYPYEEFVQELENLEEESTVLVIWRVQKPASKQGIRKAEYLADWMEKHHYRRQYSGEEYVVYGNKKL